MSYESPMLHACVCVSRGCGQRVTMSKKIKQAKRGFYEHGRDYAVSIRNDVSEENNITHFVSYPLGASVPWRTTLGVGIPAKFKLLGKSNESVDYSYCGGGGGDGLRRPRQGGRQGRADAVAVRRSS